MSTDVDSTNVDTDLAAQIEAATEQVVEEAKDGVGDPDVQAEREEEEERAAQAEHEETYEPTEDAGADDDPSAEDDPGPENEDIETEEIEEGEESGEQEVVTFSDELLTRAVRAGMDLNVARTFPNEQALATVCASMEQAKERARQIFDEALDGEEEKEEAEDPLAVFDNLDPEKFEPEVIEMLGTLAGQIRTQREEIETLRSGQEHTTQAAQDAAAREVEVWFDQQIESLGPEFQKPLGTGGYSSLSQGSSQLATRDAIAEHIAVTHAGYVSMGHTPPSRDVLFQQAVGVVLKDELANIERASVQKELRRRRGQHIQRAGSQGEKAASGTPVDETAALLDEKFFSDE
jgi:TolA-binding protein